MNGVAGYRLTAALFKGNCNILCDLTVSRLFFIWLKLSAGTLEQRKCRVRVSLFVGKKHVHVVKVNTLADKFKIQ